MSRAAEDRQAELRADVAALRATLAEAARQITMARLTAVKAIAHQHLVNAQMAVTRADLALLDLGRTD